MTAALAAAGHAMAARADSSMGEVRPAVFDGVADSGTEAGRRLATDVLPGVHGPDMKPRVADLFVGTPSLEGSTVLPGAGQPAPDLWRDHFIDTMVTGSIAPQMTRWLVPVSNWQSGAAAFNDAERHIYAGLMLIAIALMASMSFGLWRWQVRGLVEHHLHG
ncbi:hypothetical protein [Ensifer soli]|uniref:hypothetical protein n=1 Tax=Ciceribacter sp. sgz301302 TaxID=3342379 RepID=UPI0035BA7850